MLLEILAFRTPGPLRIQEKLKNAIGNPCFSDLGTCKNPRKIEMPLEILDVRTLGPVKIQEHMGRPREIHDCRTLGPSKIREVLGILLGKIFGFGP